MSIQEPQEQKKVVAIMQPYFFPYAGYFRLLNYCDSFIIFDCVQYTRRSWISRNSFSKSDGSNEWLNLPIEKCPQETLIRDVRFRNSDVPNLSKFKLSKELNERELGYLFDYHLKPVELLRRQIEWVMEKLEINCQILRSSDFQVDDELHGEARVIQIAKEASADEYVNLAGGINLYNLNHFQSNGLDLKILQPYEGQFSNILDRILNEPIPEIIDEINANTLFQSLA
jgi:hypothetical protein